MALTRAQSEEISRAVNEAIENVRAHEQNIFAEALDSHKTDSAREMREVISAAVQANKEAVPLSSGVPYFSGGVGESFEEWLKRFDRLAQANNWDETRKRDVLPWFMRGLAERMYDRLSQQDRATYDSIVAALRDKLKLSQLNDIKSVELHARVQGPNEPVTEFAESIRRLTKSAYPELSVDTQATLMKRLFLNGLRPDLRRFVLLSKPETFDEAEAQARSQEVQDHFAFGTAPYLSDRSAITAIEARLPADKKALDSGVGSNAPNLEQRFKKLEMGSQFQTGRPFQGGYNPGRGKGPASSRGRRGGHPRFWTPTGNNICFYCRKPGHHQAICRSRLRDIAARSSANSRGTMFYSRRGSFLRPQNQNVSYARRDTSNPMQTGISGRAYCIQENREATSHNNESEIEQRQEMSRLQEENSALRTQLSNFAEEPYDAFVATVNTHSREVLRGSSVAHSVGTPLSVLTVATIVSVVILLGSCGVNCTEILTLCGSSRSAHALSIPQRVTCVPPKPGSPLIKMHAELWTPRSLPRREVAWKCHSVQRKICTRVGLLGPLGGRSIVADQVTVLTMSTAQCRKALNKYLLTNDGLTELQPGLWSTNNTLAVKYKYCCYDFCENVTNLIIEKGEISTMDGKHMASDLGDVGGCRSMDGYCDVGDGMVIWNATQVSQICPFEFSSLQVVTLQDRHILVDDLQVAFSFPNKYQSAPPCVVKSPSKFIKTSMSPTSRVTEQGVVLKLYANLTQATSHSSVFNETSPLWVSSDPINSKLNYLISRIMAIETQGFRNVWLELCQVADRQLQLIWQLLRIDATLGARVLLDRTDIHGQFVGQALMTWQCRNVTPDHIHWNYRVGDKCYDMVPVTVGKQLWFLVPGSRDLVKTASVVDCHHHVSGIYRTKAGWRTERGPVQVSEVPLAIVWKGMWSAFVFNSPSIFHDHMAGLESTVTMLRSYFNRVRRMKSQLQFLVNYTADMSLNPDIFRQSFAGIGEGVGLAFHGASEILSTVGHNTTEFVSSLLKGPLQMILNIVIILAIILGALVFLYLVSKYAKQRGFDPNNYIRSFFAQKTKFFDRIQQLTSKWRSSSPVGPPSVANSWENVNLDPLEDSNNGSGPTPEEMRAYVFAFGRAAPIISVVIQDVRTPALVDTGSNIAIISRSFFLHLREFGQPPPVGLDPPDLVATSVSGHTLSLIGKVFLQVQVGDYVLLHPVHIMTSCPRNCILGTDLLSRFGEMHLNLKQSRLQLGDIVIRFVNTEKVFGSEVTQYRVSLIDGATVPGNSEVFLEGAVPKFVCGSNLLFEPSTQMFRKYELLSPPSLLSVNKHCVPVHLVNALPSPIYLYAGTTLGRVELVDVVSPMAAVNMTEADPQCRDSSALDQLDLSKADLSPAQKEQLRTLLLRYRDAFAKNDADLGRTKLVKHSIDTGSHAPIKQRPYRVPYEQREIINRHVSDMLKRGIVEPSNSDWSSPVLLVKKKDSSERFACDYRKLNTLTKKDVFPLPVIEDILLSLGQCQFFSTLDAASGYWQVELDEDAKEKSAFCTYGGLYQWNVMPFGLTNAPSTFQRLMNTALGSILWKNAFIYIDDCLVASRTFEDHLVHLGEVLQRFIDANIKLKLRKCEFARFQVPFLGHIVSKSGIGVDRSKVEKLQNFSPPTSATTLKSFLGLASYYRRFIKSFAEVAAPLHSLLRKSVTFVWTEACQKAFVQLKELLTTAPILAYPDFSEGKEFILSTDASGFAIGAVLSQETERPIAYASRSLQSSERNYSTTDKECLAVVWAVKHFRPYIYNRRCVIYTDHVALKWLHSHPNPSGRLCRWALVLQEYDLEIRYRPGRANAVADCLSRISPNECLVVQAKESSQFDASDLAAKQRADPEFGSMFAYLEAGVLPQEERKKQFCVSNQHQYALISGLLHFVDSNATDGVRLVIPACLRPEILESFHDDVFAGHFGFKRTLEKIRSRYFWTSMFSDVRQYCMNCMGCATRKNPHRNIRAPLVSQEISEPFATLVIDCLGPFPLTEKGNKQVVVVTETLTKWVEAFAVPDIKAETIARLFVTEIVCRHSAPRTLLSDMGTNFLSALVLEVCTLMDTRKINSTAFHPQTQGITERYNKTLATCLSMYVSSSHRDWDIWLPYCLFAYRTSQHESTQESPFFLLYGRDARLPIDVALKPPSPYLVDADDYKIELVENLSRAWQLVKTVIGKAQRRQKNNYDQHVHLPGYKAGIMRVWVNNPATPPGKCGKFTPHWHGPYRVVEVQLPNLRVRLCEKPDSDPIRVHVNRCKLCLSAEVPKSSTQAPSSDPSDAAQTLDMSTVNLNGRASKTTYNLRPRPAGRFR